MWTRWLPHAPCRRWITCGLKHIYIFSPSEAQWSQSYLPRCRIGLYLCSSGCRGWPWHLRAVSTDLCAAHMSWSRSWLGTVALPLPAGSLPVGSALLMPRWDPAVPLVPSRPICEVRVTALSSQSCERKMSPHTGSRRHALAVSAVVQGIAMQRDSHGTLTVSCGEGWRASGVYTYVCTDAWLMATVASPLALHPVLLPRPHHQTFRFSLD